MRIHLPKTCSLLFIAAFFLTCREQSAPDVSTIPVTFSIQRFEKDFFSIDTLQVDRSLDRLNEKYPDFLPPFITQVLGLNPQKDSLTFNENLIRFIRDYKPIFDSSEHRFGDMKTVEKEIREGLQRVLYYFPQYRTPGSLITFIGPMDAIFTASLSSYSDIITEHALGSGLQLHLGAGFSFYHSPMGQALYPDYISRRFTPETIVVNALKNIIDDMYPEQREDNVLVDQMVEKGKRLYLLDQFLPNMPDTIKIGYTYSQWKGCIENEGKIWNYFVTNNLLMSNDPLVLQRFMDEGPQTPELGEGSPGYIGLFTGKRIVETYMQKNDSISLEQLLKTPARTIFQESKYRPK